MCIMRCLMMNRIWHVPLGTRKCARAVSVVLVPARAMSVVLVPARATSWV